MPAKKTLPARLTALEQAAEDAVIAVHPPTLEELEETIRYALFDELDAERDAQIAQWGHGDIQTAHDHDDEHAFRDWPVFIMRQLVNADAAMDNLDLLTGHPRYWDLQAQSLYKHRRCYIKAGALITARLEALDRLVARLNAPKPLPAVVVPTPAAAPVVAASVPVSEI